MTTPLAGARAEPETRVSVAMCTYQGERFLAEQLDSIATQSRLPDELVVRDDGSSDRTVALVADFAARAPFAVDLAVNSTRLGPSANFGSAIAACSGDLILLADQDDVWYPAKVERITETFAAEPAPGLVFSDADIVDSASAPVGRTCWGAFGLAPHEVKNLTGPGRFPAFLQRQRRHGCTVTGATMALRADLRRFVLPMPDAISTPGFHLLHDAWMVLVLAAVAPVAPIPERLMAYRRHEAQAAGLPATDKAPPAGVVTGLRGSSRLAGKGAGKDEELGWLAPLASRLIERGAGIDPGKLRARLAHLEARQGLPRGRLRRLPPVMFELLSGHYHAYSSGLRSAARDLS